MLSLTRETMLHKSVLRRIARSIPSKCSAPVPFEKYSEFDSIKESQFNELLASPQEWIAEEKVNGANFSIHIFKNGADVRFAKRSGFIGEHEFFFGYTKLKSEFNRQVPLFLSALKKNFGKAESAIIHGEIFGAKYIHPEIPQQSKFTEFKGQSRRISPIIGDFFPQYSPDVHFYAYDIKYRTDSSAGWTLLSPDQARSVFRTIPGLLYARELFRGNMRKCMAFDLDRFETLIPHFLGLGDFVIPCNIAEGIVLKKSSRSGEVIHVTKSSILKFKHRAFQEARHSDTAKKGMTVEAERPKFIQKMGETVLSSKEILTASEQLLLESLLNKVDEASWLSTCASQQEASGKKFAKAKDAVLSLAQTVLKQWIQSSDTSTDAVSKFSHTVKKLFVHWLTSTAENYVRSMWSSYMKSSIAREAT